MDWLDYDSADSVVISLFWDRVKGLFLYKTERLELQMLLLLLYLHLLLAERKDKMICKPSTTHNHRALIWNQIFGHNCLSGLPDKFFCLSNTDKSERIQV